MREGSGGEGRKGGRGKRKGGRRGREEGKGGRGREGKGGEGMCINTQFYNHPMRLAVKPSNTRHT